MIVEGVGNMGGGLLQASEVSLLPVSRMQDQSKWRSFLEGFAKYFVHCSWV